MKMFKNELEKKIKELHGILRKEVTKKWKRSLPLEEELFDRWERAKYLKFGKKTSIYQLSYVYGDVKVGKNTWIGPFTILDGSGGLRIGDNCSISCGVQIYSHDTVKWAVSGGKVKYEYRKTKIGDCCFIGPQSVILRGVSIGSHSIVAASSFVSKDVPPFSIVAGIPAKVIGKVVIKKEKVKLNYFSSSIICKKTIK
ncbi:MAG: acyltransferase [Candidatus Pacebacteria bacterium]|nr:acyltransferase [Candidatus Paceibacterota bacterium]